MVRILALTAILALTLIPGIEAHEGHDHHHHHHHRDHVSEKRSGSVHHEIGLLNDHDQHSHSDAHEHCSHDHSHGHDREHSRLEKHAHGHTHGHEDLRLSEGILEKQDSEDHLTPKLTAAGLWFWSLGCSLLVSLASLISLILLPLIFFQGKPSKTVVDGLAGFGAGSMLGDALLHQLPHAFGGSGGHSHTYSAHEHVHGHGHEEISGHAHGHSLQDLSVGLAVLGGILLFFLVEKIVRRTEELSVHGEHRLGHSHHHHGSSKKENEHVKDGITSGQGEVPFYSGAGMRKRKTSEAEEREESVTSAGVNKTATGGKANSPIESGAVPEESSKAVLGYLNLFSDGVHNFTDGMALGSAFLLHGRVGGWSRTLFLLAHELPQEVGDFGILLRSGFGVFKALAFNFLSALVALLGTVLALVLGGDPGHSALIEGFTAGGFIYIAIGAVMPDMHSQGSSLKTTLFQLTALSLGMGVAIVISLAE